MWVLGKDVHTPEVTPPTKVYSASYPRHERSTYSVTLPNQIAGYSAAVIEFVRQFRTPRVGFWRRPRWHHGIDVTGDRAAVCNWLRPRDRVWSRDRVRLPVFDSACVKSFVDARRWIPTSQWPPRRGWSSFKRTVTRRAPVYLSTARLYACHISMPSQSHRAERSRLYDADEIYSKSVGQSATHATNMDFHSNTNSLPRTKKIALWRSALSVRVPGCHKLQMTA